jgi:hypothetical protein
LAWAVVKGTVAIPAIILFAVIPLPTSPHFRALAMKYRDDADKNAPAVAGANPGIRKYGRMADLRRPEIRLNRVRADQGVGFGPEGWPVNRRLSGRWLEPNARHTSQKPLTSKHAVRGLSRLCGCMRWVAARAGGCANAYASLGSCLGAARLGQNRHG